MPTLNALNHPLQNYTNGKHRRKQMACAKVGIYSLKIVSPKKKGSLHENVAITRMKESANKLS